MTTAPKDEFCDGVTITITGRTPHPMASIASYVGYILQQNKFGTKELSLHQPLFVNEVTLEVPDCTSRGSLMGRHKQTKVIFPSSQ